MTPAQHQLVIDHLYLARTIAGCVHRKLPRWARFDDLEADGQFGLVIAALRFDPAKGVGFKTYCQDFVHGAIIDGLNDKTWLADWRTIKRHANTETPVPSFEFYGPRLSRRCAQIDPLLTRAPQRDAARTMLATLTPRQSSAVWLRYAEGLELEEAGRAIGVCAAWVHQLCAAALQKLRSQNRVDTNSRCGKFAP